jgi:hypothetical protein
VAEQSSATGVAETDDNDWRVTVRLAEGGQAGKAAEHLKAHQVEAEVHQRLGGRVMVAAAGNDELFLYAHSSEAAAAAQQAAADALEGHGLQAGYTVERWHPVEEEWEAADVSMPETAAAVAAERQRLDAAETKDSLAAGHALFEIRVVLPSHHESVALAARLKSEGYSVVRRWRFLVVGANNADEADEFAARIRQEAPAGAEVSTEEVGPLLPFTAFDLAAGAGL